ncbi:hypothetical protein Efla_000720 [Eimeria flavescens]
MTSRNSRLLYRNPQSPEANCSSFWTWTTPWFTRRPRAKWTLICGWLTGLSSSSSRHTTNSPFVQQGAADYAAAVVKILDTKKKLVSDRLVAQTSYSGSTSKILRKYVVRSRHHAPLLALPYRRFVHLLVSSIFFKRSADFQSSVAFSAGPLFGKSKMQLSLRFGASSTCIRIAVPAGWWHLTIGANFWRDLGAANIVYAFEYTWLEKFGPGLREAYPPLAAYGGSHLDFSPRNSLREQHQQQQHSTWICRHMDSLLFIRHRVQLGPPCSQAAPVQLRV